MVSSPRHVTASQYVKVLAEDLVGAGKQRVEVIVHGQMTATEPVEFAHGYAQQYLGPLMGLRASTLGQFVANPFPHPAFGKSAGAVLASACSPSPIARTPGSTLNTLIPYRLVSEPRFSVSLMTAALDTE